MRSGLLVVACGIALAGLPATSTVAAPIIRECTYDEDSQVQRCQLSIGPVPVVSVDLDSGEEGARVPLRWTRTPGSNITATPGGTRPGVAELACPPFEVDGVVHVGQLFIVRLVNTETGAVLRTEYECVYPGDPLPEAPPPPPSLAEFTEAADLVLTVDAQINPNPAWGGITGVETWLWCDPPEDVDVEVDLRGWSAEATMSPVQFHWDVAGTATAEFHPTACGSEAEPGASWMPETKGSYGIALSATWAGSWTLSYGGSPMGTFVLGPIDVDGEPEPYEVGEHVGVLTDGGDG